MRLREYKVLSGPNYWSARRHHLVVMKLDLEELEYRPTHTINGFYERLTSLLPSLYEHKCSEGYQGGFFQRVKDGTWLGHVIEHIAIEIQIMAGMYCPFGKTRSTAETGVYNVVYEYRDREAGLYAGEAAIRIAVALIDGREYDIDHDIATLSDLRDRNMPGPSTEAIIQEAKSRNIPCTRLDNDSLVLLGHGKNQRMISSSMTSLTGCIGVDIACNKDQTKQMLNNARIPMPEGRVADNEETLFRAADELGYPLVIKPLKGNHGRGTSINLTCREELPGAYHRARKFSGKVIVEKLVKGSDFRMLVVDYKFVAACTRIPASVTGNGRSTIGELIDKKNSEPDRGCGHERELTKITVDESTRFLLNKNGYSLNSIPNKNETVFLKATANLSTGGTGIDITDSVHPYNVALAERVARIIGLDICGIDLMADSLAIPVRDNGGVVLEVNAEPGLRMHLLPVRGRPRNVAKPIIDMLYPGDKNGRIPITAITGTNGKTTTSRLLNHIAAHSGHYTGLTTSDGIYINGELIDEGDCTGPESAGIVLREPGVDFAVLECARGGILRAGLGFSACDVGVVTNVNEDHIGLNDIHNLDQLTQLKSVIPKSIRPDGYAVLNADDDRVYAMGEDLTCGIALFSLSGNNSRISHHNRTGGLTACLVGEDIILQDGNRAVTMTRMTGIPITFGGKARFNVQNILAAVLAAYIQDIPVDDIISGLQTFSPTTRSIPGRMNLFQFRNFRLLVDYAHNPSALNALGDYLGSVQATKQCGIITAVGDRRDVDIINLGRCAGNIFDEIIIKHDNDLRGRTRDEISALILQGIRQTSPLKPVKIISPETDAVTYAIQNAEPGSFITVLCAEVQEVISLVYRMLEKDSMEEEMVGQKQ
ncbi:MAG: cyanophycin synthetase [Balneolales bacterium]